MKVETFECTETATEPIEATEEAISIMRSLGLDGQIAATRSDKNGNKQRIPFRVMTKDERFVYGVLCPTVCDIKEYKASPIPLRVLQLAAHAKESEFFDKLVVWDRAEAAIPDPVLVGVWKDPESTWATKNYILARWGDELDAFVTLLGIALKARRKTLADKLHAIKREVNRKIGDEFDMTDEEIMAKNPDWSPSVYID